MHFKGGAMWNKCYLLQKCLLYKTKQFSNSVAEQSMTSCIDNVCTDFCLIQGNSRRHHKLVVRKTIDLDTAWYPWFVVPEESMVVAEITPKVD